VTLSSDAKEALGLLGRRPFDIVLADLGMPHMDGVQVVATALAKRPSTLVIVMTGNPTVEASVAFMRAGAWEYLPKPFASGHLQTVFGRAAQTVVEARARGTNGAHGVAAGRRPQTTRTQAGLELLGSSTVFRRAIELAARVAPTDASVFISGESGSGKELVARFIHANSRRAEQPFVAVNCAALPELLLESEMFGHREGAFTGATRDQVGLLEMANGGALFLDELLELPKSAQAKLLRVIQDGSVRRLGSEETDAVVDLRFISATSGDVEAACQKGTIREELYFRLRVVPIHLPPLRERVEDIPILADYFLGQFWEHRRGDPHERPQLAEPALAALAEHPWRGNIRELQNVMEHVAILAQPGATIEADALPLTEAGDAPGAAGRMVPISTSFEESYHAARKRVLAQFEIQYLRWLVDRANGNLSEAARIGGLDRTTLYRVMDRHGLQRRAAATGDGRASEFC
jgi:DNA-binding NtrC family response regulator